MDKNTDTKYEMRDTVHISSIHTIHTYCRIYSKPLISEKVNGSKGGDVAAKPVCAGRTTGETCPPETWRSEQMGVEPAEVEDQHSRAVGSAGRIERGGGG